MQVCEGTETWGSRCRRSRLNPILKEATCVVQFRYGWPLLQQGCAVRLKKPMALARQVYYTEYDLFMAPDLNDRSESGNRCQW